MRPTNDELIAEQLSQASERVAHGGLVETTGRKRDRSFVYRAYLDRLRVGTELGGARVSGR